MNVETMVKALKQLELDEGRKEYPYQDTVGKWTIGIGHNLSDAPLPGEVIDLLFKLDVANARKDLVKNFTWFQDLDDARQWVLTNMCFNLGITRLKAFKKTLEYIAEKDYLRASREMLRSKWAKQVGARAQRLSAVLRTGFYP